MKTMRCNQLGGPCNHEFHANTFDEIAALSKKHGMEMFEKGDKSHINAMHQMRRSMQSPENMKVWLEMKRKEFDALPENL